MSCGTNPFPPQGLFPCLKNSVLLGKIGHHLWSSTPLASVSPRPPHPQLLLRSSQSPATERALRKRKTLDKVYLKQLCLMLFAHRTHFSNYTDEFSVGSFWGRDTPATLGENLWPRCPLLPSGHGAPCPLLHPHPPWRIWPDLLDPQCSANYWGQVLHLPALVRRGVASLPFPHPLLVLLQSVPPRPLISPFTFSTVLWAHLLPFAPLFCTLTAPSAAVAQSHFWPGIGGSPSLTGKLAFQGIFEASPRLWESCPPWG